MKNLDKKPTNKNSLEEYKLEYETTDVKPTRGRANIRGFVSSKYTGAKTHFTNVVKKVSHPIKKHKKVTKLERQEAINRRNRGIIGIGRLLVIMSIAYSTSVIFIGIDTVESKIALLPQAIFALSILIKVFYTNKQGDI